MYISSSTAQSANGFVQLDRTITTGLGIWGSCIWTTPNGSSETHMHASFPACQYLVVRKCLLTCNCTGLENSQRLMKALKDADLETVQSLLVHPSNVSAVVEQLRCRSTEQEF
ncbi:uncharacterized protein DMAD_00108 [Drosophila madeirensis]|uniref:Uncharacterized protein n=1 Tax=Drosophila madeirensis TaxID=30013 RepID=A0AAU9FW24_DROMD